ncbi:hypothetical protein ACTA71_001469 [Dictyostelium dimigraforme]
MQQNFNNFYRRPVNDNYYNYNNYPNNNYSIYQPPNFPSRKSKSPTFINRLIGVRPSNDSISLLKYKLRIYRVLSIIVGFILLTVFFSITNFRSRSTSFNLEYNNQTYLPETIWVFDPPFPSDIFEFDLYLENIQTKTFDTVVGGGNISTLTGNFTYYGLFGNCLFAEYSDDGFNNTYFGLVIRDQCVYLYENEQIIVRVYKHSRNENRDWNILMQVDNQLSFLNAEVQMSVLLSKSIVTYQNGETDNNYKVSKTISYSSKNYTTYKGLPMDAYSYGMSFSTNMVLEEKTQTNFLVIVSILSNLGSMLTVLLSGSEVFFGFVTKFLIRDMSAWVDDLVRECFIRNSNQIIQKNLNLNKNESNQNNHCKDGDEDDNDDKNTTKNGNEDEGINDDMSDEEIEDKNNNKDSTNNNFKNSINPLIINDQLEGEEEKKEKEVMIIENMDNTPPKEDQTKE